MSDCVLSRSPNNVDNIKLENGETLTDSVKKLQLDASPAVGEVVECNTVSSTFKGVVLVFDANANFIVLCDNCNIGKPKMHMINLNHIICIKKISVSSPNFTFTIPKISHEEGQRRLELMIKKIGLDWKIFDASENAIAAFLALKKIYDDVHWDGKRIIALRSVIISDPFNENAVVGLDDRLSTTQALLQIKKKLILIHSTTENKEKSQSGDSLLNHQN